MTYRGYTAKVGFDEQGYHGKLIGISDLVLFEGKTTISFIKDFYDAVDGYIEMLQEIGRESK